MIVLYYVFDIEKVTSLENRHLNSSVLVSKKHVPLEKKRWYDLQNSCSIVIDDHYVIDVQLSDAEWKMQKLP